MKSKYKPLPRSTKFIVDFHDGIHSHYCTKGDIIKMNTCFERHMSISLINTLNSLEFDCKERAGDIVVCGAVGYVTDLNSKKHSYTLDIAAHRIGAQ